MSTPWQVTNRNTKMPPTVALASPTPLPLLTPFLGQPYCPKPVLFSPIRESAKKIMSQSPIIMNSKMVTANGGFGGGTENKSQQANDTGRVSDTETALSLLATKQPKSPRNNEEVTLPTDDTTKSKTTEIISRLGQYDVVFGQGPKHRHVNKEFYFILETHSTANKKKDKSAIVQSVINTIKSKGGRFLKKVPESGDFIVLVSDAEIRKKIIGSLNHFNRKYQKIGKQTPPTVVETFLKPDTVPDATGVDVAAPLPSAPSIESIVVSTINLSGSHPAKCLGNLDSLAVKVKSSESSAAGACRPKQKKKRDATNGAGFGGEKKRFKKAALPASNQGVPKPRTYTRFKKGPAFALPKQLDGVRVSVTKSGAFEARYKPKGLDKKTFPKYIACVSDRETAISVGNVVATLLKENPEMSFAAAKEEALRRYKPLDGQENAESASTTLPNNLVQEVVDELIKGDKHSTNQ